MQTKVHFKKGDIVKVVNRTHRCFEEMAEVVTYLQFSNRYLIQLHNGYQFEVLPTDIVKYLSHQEEKRLLESHLLQLIDLALSTKDKKWFEELMIQLRQLENRK